MARRERRRWRPRRDWGRGLALALCLVFALIGAIPLGLGFLVRTGPVRAWAARETSAVLARELGVGARYEVHVQAWPMMIALDDVVVDASDGGSPFLEVERASIRPRPFSLLAGELDVGDVEIVGPRIRAVVRDGQLANLRYRLPESQGGDGEGPRRAPFSSIAITDAHIDATVDGLHVATREVDIDVSAEQDSAFEVALRAGSTTVVHTHPMKGREDHDDAVDEDVVCRLDARVRVEPGGVTVRRLTLLGSADFDPDPGTAPSCSLAEGDWRAVEVRLGAVRVGLPAEGLPTVSGRVRARLPVPLAHRFVKLPHASGAIDLDAEVDFDGRTKLPRVTGKLTTFEPGIDGKVFSARLDADLSIAADVIRLSKIEARWADGLVSIAEAKVEPFAKGIPIHAGPVEIRGIEFAGLMRDLGVHPQAHVGMTLREAHLDHFGGTADPLRLEGPLQVHCKNFEVFDRPTTDPARNHMVGVKEGTLRGSFQVKENAVVFQGFSIDTPRSHLLTTVVLDLREVLDIEVAEGSHVELDDLSPLASVPLSGMMTLKANAHGAFDHPLIKGEIAVKDFHFGGFPVGEIEKANVAFEPLVLTFTEARIRHNTSRAKATTARIAFDEGPDVLVDADIDTREAPGMGLRDFFEIFHFEKDPRFEEISGRASGTARVHYALGGREDKCGGGYLDVKSQMKLADVRLYGERYDDGALDMDFVWDDQAAGDAGMVVDIRSASLRKGAGTILASGNIRHGGVVRADAIASGIPIERFDAFGPAAKMFDGSVSMVASVSGTLAQLETLADVNVSRVRIGPDSLPPSRFRLALEPNGQPPRVLGKTRCQNIRTAPFDRAEYDRDLSAGLYRVNGELFGGQIALDNVTMTQQRHKVVAGKATVAGLDLGTLANLIPGVAFAGSAPKGSLSAAIDVKALPLDDPKKSEIAVSLTKVSVARDGHAVELAEPSGPIELRGDELTVPDLRLKARSSSGLGAVFVAGGAVHKVMSAPDLDLGVRVEPVELSRLSADLAQVARASGTADATLRVTGSPSAPRYKGEAHVRKGELDLKDPRLSFDQIDVDVVIGGGDVRVTRAVAHVGGGTVSMTARMPVRGLEVGTATATVAARGVKLNVADGVEITTNADLDATFLPGAEGEGEGKNLPSVTGEVSLTSFSYTRPIAMSVSLDQLTGKAQRTQVDAYNPADDVVRFNVNVSSPKPLRFTNNLVDMQLEVSPPGLVLSGTNQRFGARGMLRILPESKLQLRSSEFEVREGYVRFDDPSRIAPKVDVRAQTEYRRYASAAPSAAEGAGDTGSAGTSGQWRINLHAHGDADDLKVALSSDPPLGQEDILLLLTLGMTRAEIDRGLASSLGETVGLEALSSLTGADKAVKTIVPLIDEFRFGTAYSSRTGRSEPTVTLGKRITDDVRANVTTGITENREVRSSIEWRLNKRVSVQGSYDNVNDVSSSLVGNVGVDLRWRLEFE